MKTVLVLGGYGGFGARVSKLLAEQGFTVIVAGRNIGKAAAFCRANPGLALSAEAVDRTAPIEPHLRRLRPWLVIDAAGPFQNSDYGVPYACIAAGCHYTDLADARGFVTGIRALDAAARRAGVSVISGASSLPALSGAVADSLAAGLDTVGSIDIALSASNRASGSRSVTQAILSYVGKSVRLWRGGRWTDRHGWQEMGKVRYTLPGRRPVVHRVALCDVPDLDLLPERYPGRPSARFRAGTEIELQNIALWLLSWIVRWGWLRSSLPFAAFGLTVQQLLRRVGGDRSAMRVDVRGASGGRALLKRWTLIAEGGDGPWVPCFASVLIATKLADGEIAPGAAPAGGLLALGDFEPFFGRFELFTAIEQHDVPALYRRIMGGAFDRLPPEVRRMHEPGGDLGACGSVTVERPRGPAARLIGRLFAFPPAMREAAVTIQMREEEGGEIWTRSFGGYPLRSRLRREGPHLVECFGLLRFVMELRSEPDGLSMHHVGWRIGALPMPRVLRPSGVAIERAVDGRFHFDVPIALPLIGRLIRYRGWLDPAG